MDFDIQEARKRTADRNKPGIEPHRKQRLTNILNTAELINKTEPGHYRTILIKAYWEQVAEFEALN